MLPADVADPAASGQASGDDARIDVNGVLEVLSPVQRQLCSLLGAQGLSITEAAEALGMPRATVYDEIGRIRRVFAARGLHVYLER